MTNQQIFDTILSHLRMQKYSCMSDRLCRYYDPETERKCAVGCLIPTEMYDPQMDDLEDTWVYSNGIVKDCLEKIGINLEESLQLLADMQFIHDEMYEAEWGESQEEDCQKVAIKYNLVYTPD